MKLPHFSIDIETIKPSDISMDNKKVKFLLKDNYRSRIDWNRVAKYARDMVDGKWTVTHQGSLLKGQTNHVLDGQHRLLGIVQADVPVVTSVIRGGVSHVSLDQGKPRRLRDALRYVKEPYSDQMEQALAWLWKFKSGDFIVEKYTGTTAQLLELYNSYGVTMSKIVGKIMSAEPAIQGISAGILGAVIQYATKGKLTKECTYFIDGLSTGANLNTGDPVLVLKNEASRWAMKGKTASVRQLTKVAAVINAWNYMRSGDLVTKADIMQNSGPNKKPLQLPR